MEMRVIFTTPARGSVDSVASTDRGATTDTPSLLVCLQEGFRNFAEYVEILEAISREITQRRNFSP